MGVATGAGAAHRMGWEKGGEQEHEEPRLPPCGRVIAIARDGDLLRSWSWIDKQHEHKEPASIPPQNLQRHP